MVKYFEHLDSLQENRRDSGVLLNTAKGEGKLKQKWSLPLLIVISSYPLNLECYACVQKNPFFS